MSERRVLIVDDENSLRKVLSDLLRLRGFDPIAVGSGEEALEVLAANPADVSIIDLALHEGGGSMDGMELLRRIRVQYPAIECIVLTGAPSQRSAIEAVTAGAFSYLLKPFNMNELMSSLERALEKRRQHRELDSLQVRAQAADERQAKMLGRLRSECVSSLHNLLALAQNIMECSNPKDAHAFAKLIRSEAQGVLTAVEEVISEAGGADTV